MKCACMRWGGGYVDHYTIVGNVSNMFQIGFFEMFNFYNFRPDPLKLSPSSSEKLPPQLVRSLFPSPMSVFHLNLDMLSYRIATISGLLHVTSSSLVILGDLPVVKAHQIR